MLGMDPDGPGIGKSFVFAMAGKAKVVVVIGFDQLGSTGPSVRVMAIKAEDPGIKMATPLKVEPLLMMGFRMGLRVPPDSRLKLVIVGKGVSYSIRFIIFVIPWKLESSVGDTDPSRMALAANLEAPFVLQFSRMDNFTLRLWRLDVFGGRAMAFFTSNIEFDIFGFVS